MHRKVLIIAGILAMVALYSCSRKTHPAKTTTETATRNSNTRSADSVAVTEKKMTRRKEKAPVPKVIVVNDNAAHKSVDGRLYYDMLGHRYWRNYKDGKYYLFNKSMYNDDAFKPK